MCKVLGSTSNTARKKVLYIIIWKWVLLVLLPTECQKKTCVYRIKIEESFAGFLPHYPYSHLLWALPSLSAVDQHWCRIKRALDLIPDSFLSKPYGLRKSSHFSDLQLIIWKWEQECCEDQTTWWKQKAFPHTWCIVHLTLCIHRPPFANSTNHGSKMYFSLQRLSVLNTYRLYFLLLFPNAE
jgi:hypothetical protein